MQLTPAAILVALLAAPLSTLAAASTDGGNEGESCVIPHVIPGKDTIVDMPYIDKQFCGMVLINKMYVLIDAIADKIETGPVKCDPAGMCSKSVRYIFNDVERTGAPSHTIIFKGPKVAKPAKPDSLSNKS